MGKYSASVKGGLFAQYSSGLASVDVYNNAKDHRRLAQELSHKKNLEYRGIVDQLVFSGVGGTAIVNYYEIAASPELGGLRPIVNSQILNRAVVINDLNDVRETLTSLSSDTYTPIPVYNGDRNPLGTR
jgi:hypothetical protein